MPNNNRQNSNSLGNRSSRRGFAAMDPERQREIASKGGKASGGNFKNNPQRASEAGRKGGSR
jgi:general stress protein YciG